MNGWEINGYIATLETNIPKSIHLKDKNNINFGDNKSVKFKIKNAQNGGTIAFTVKTTDSYYSYHGNGKIAHILIENIPNGAFNNFNFVDGFATFGQGDDITINIDLQTAYNLEFKTNGIKQFSFEIDPHNSYGIYVGSQEAEVTIQLVP